MVWHLLPTISAPMSFQMALDEILFGSQKKDPQAPVLRFYVSSDAWISVGCSFRDEAAFAKSELIREHPKVPICRRMTGGGCVLHGQDLIFSLVAPLKDPVFVSKAGFLNGLESVRTSYEKIHESVRMGLEMCGLDPKFYSRGDELPRGSDCFDFPVERDLSWKGKKIAGGAQKRSEGVLLHHESIMAPEGVERDRLANVVRRGIEQVFGETMENTVLDPELYFQAERGAHGRILKLS